jgi:hypothetical protein
VSGRGILPLLLSGDLDGDGAEESAALIWTSSGGLAAVCAGARVAAQG